VPAGAPRCVRAVVSVHAGCTAGMNVAWLMRRSAANRCGSGCGCGASFASARNVCQSPPNSPPYRVSPTPKPPLSSTGVRLSRGPEVAGHDLAGGVAGQLVEEHHVAGHAETSQSTRSTERFLKRSRISTQHVDQIRPDYRQPRTVTVAGQHRGPSIRRHAPGV